jgi:hypothetical protein
MSDQRTTGVVSWAVARLFIAVWLAVFTVQAADLLTIVAPDSCTEDVQGSAADPCADGCARCVCCARVPVFLPQGGVASLDGALVRTAPVPPLAPSTTPSPRGVLHVPKRSLT